MWIPKTASAELDIFPNAEVEGRFPLSGGKFSLTSILPPFQTLNNELILYQALKFGDSNVKLGNKIVNDLLRT